jgi:hypothetical protein
MQTFIIKDEKIRQNAMRYLQNLEAGYMVEFKKAPKGLTDQQRRYWHMLLGILADWKGEETEEVKQELKRRWGMYRIIEFEGENVRELQTSEKLSRDEYAMCIEKTQQILMYLGINFPRPEELGMRPEIQKGA